jgi:hypothetical protein
MQNLDQKLNLKIKNCTRASEIFDEQTFVIEKNRKQLKKI